MEAQSFVFSCSQAVCLGLGFKNYLVRKTIMAGLKTAHLTTCYRFFFLTHGVMSAAPSADQTNVQTLENI